MAITFETMYGALKKGFSAGDVKVAVTKTTGPASYSTGGFNVTVGGLGEIVAAIVVADGGYLAEVDYANSSGNILKVKARYFDYDAAADGNAIEVAATTDLSGVNFYVIAFGW